MHPLREYRTYDDQMIETIEEAYDNSAHNLWENTDLLHEEMKIDNIHYHQLRI